MSGRMHRGWALLWTGVIVDGRYCGQALLGALTVMDCPYYAYCEVSTGSALYRLICAMPFLIHYSLLQRPL